MGEQVRSPRVLSTGTLRHTSGSDAKRRTIDMRMGRNRLSVRSFLRKYLIAQLHRPPDRLSSSGPGSWSSRRLRGTLISLSAHMTTLFRRKASGILLVCFKAEMKSLSALHGLISRLFPYTTTGRFPHAPVKLDTRMFEELPSLENSHPRTIPRSTPAAYHFSQGGSIFRDALHGYPYLFAWLYPRFRRGSNTHIRT